MEAEDRLKAELTELQAEIAQLSAESYESDLGEDQPSQCGGHNTNMNHSEDDDRYPTFHMFILAIAVISSAIALTTLFPYIGFMIIDVGIASNIDEAGYYSGAIGEYKQKYL